MQGRLPPLLARPWKDSRTLQAPYVVVSRTSAQMLRPTPPGSPWEGAADIEHGNREDSASRFCFWPWHGSSETVGQRGALAPCNAPEAQQALRGTLVWLSAVSTAEMGRRWQPQAGAWGDFGRTPGRILSALARLGLASLRYLALGRAAAVGHAAEQRRRGVSARRLWLAVRQRGRGVKVPRRVEIVTVVRRAQRRDARSRLRHV